MAVAIIKQVVDGRDVTARAAHGAKHVLHNETELKYSGADFGSVKPPLLPKAPQ